MFIALKNVTVTVERDVIIKIVVVVFLVVVLVQSAFEIIAQLPGGPCNRIPFTCFNP